MGKPEWCGRPDFATPEARRENAEVLDRLIGRWTATQEARALVRRLQRLGVPLLGEHTHEALGDLLGMGREEVDRLIALGVLR